MRIYGPYKRPDGRSHVIHYDPKTDTRRTQSLPRYLMEQYLGRKLKPEEEVDHIDDDVTNNIISNFQLLSGPENKRKRTKPPVMLTLECVRCGRPFQRSERNEIDYRKQGKTGPYCSRHCSGKIHH